MAHSDFLLFLIISILISVSTIQVSKNKSDALLKNNNVVILSKIKSINNAVNNYCQDSSYSGQPTISDLNSSNYLPNFDNDTNYGSGFTLDFSNYDNKAYTVNFNIPFELPLNDFSKNRLYSVFGSKPTCITDKTDSNYGDCSIVIPLEKQCL